MRSQSRLFVMIIVPLSSWGSPFPPLSTASGEFALQFCKDLSIGGFARQVLPFLGVVAVIVEFRAAVAPFNVTPAVSSQTEPGDLRAACDVRERGVVDGLVRFGEERLETLAFHGCGNGQAAEFGNGRVDVEKLDEALAHCGFHSRRDEQKRRAARAIEERVLVPPTALTEVITMIADENDYRLVPKFEPVQRVHQPAELRVGLRDTSVVMGEKIHPVRVVEVPEGLLERPAAERMPQQHGGVRWIAVQLK